MLPEIDRSRLAAEIAIVDGHADVWRLFDRAERLRELAIALVEPFRGVVSKVAGIEGRGFILGTAAALELNVGFVPIRKSEGLFPGAKATVETEVDYRGNQHTLRVQRVALRSDDRVLVVDDWIETGSQARAARNLIEECGGQYVGLAVVVQEISSAPAALGRVHALLDAHQLAWRD